MRLPVEPTQYGWHYLSSVIAGLDPAIHLLRKTHLTKRMDPRVKPAGDAGEWIRAEPITALIIDDHTPGNTANGDGNDRFAALGVDDRDVVTEAVGDKQLGLVA
jgi:hypothetical protein